MLEEKVMTMSFPLCWKIRVIMRRLICYRMRRAMKMSLFLCWKQRGSLMLQEEKKRS